MGRYGLPALVAFLIIQVKISSKLMISAECHYIPKYDIGPEIGTDTRFTSIRLIILSPFRDFGDDLVARRLTVLSIFV